MSDLKILKTESGQQVVDYEYAKSIIEQQQARIAELEATVDTLHSALRHLHHNAKVSGAEMGLALDVANEALESTPQQNLNAVKREVAREAFIAGAKDAVAFISQQLRLGKTDIDLDAGLAAGKYIERVKDGE